MCGRFVITSPPAAIRAAFDYGEQPNFPARHNIAPTQPVGVVLMEQGARHFRLMRWGFVPGWVKDPRAFALVINARAETVRDKPAFRNAIRRRRCLIPADGYYEWQTVDRAKHPYFIHPREGGLIGFAGVAETWCGPNGEEVDTVTIAPRDFARWLDCAAIDVNDVASLMVAPPDGAFAWHRVSREVNHVANDDARLILPLSDRQIAAEAKPAPRKRIASDDGGQGTLF